MTSAVTSFEAVAWAWVDHLRHRGTCPWREWAAQPGDPPGELAEPPGRRLPGAAQLEVVRRLAGRPGSAAVSFAELADLVLGRAAPGRGPDDLPLVWSGDRPAAFGPPPVDPARLPADELVRVLVGTIAELLVRTPASSPRRRRGRAPAFPVAGSVAPAAAVRAGLAAAGNRPREVAGAAVVLAEPVDRMLGHTWAQRVGRGGIAPWNRYVERWARQGGLPPPVDLPAVAARWADRVGVDHVHVVVVGAGGWRSAARVAGQVLGLNVPEAPARRSLAPGQAELVRLVNRVLRGRVRDEEHRRLLRRLVPRVAADPAGHVPAIPARNAGWATATTSRVRDALVEGGYRLHGDPDDLTLRGTGGSAPEEWDLLTVALDTCLDLAADPATSVVLTPAGGGR